MKTRFLILVGFLSLWTMVFGMLTTQAWFSDSAVSTGTIITTGTLDIEISGGPLVAEGLAPGGDYIDMGSFCAVNTGNVDLKYRGIFEAAPDSANDMLAYISMKVEENIGGDWILRKEISAGPGGGSDDLTDYFIIPGQSPDTTNLYILTGTLTPAQQACYRFEVKLAAATPNEFQGKYIDYIFHVSATQTNNTGWE